LNVPRPTLAKAKAEYPHRFTMEHVPAWARKPAPNGRFYAPQYRSDREWYERTTFPGEPGHLGFGRDCYSSRQTWPLGEWLDKPFDARRAVS
jgi:hypothetical protein